MDIKKITGAETGHVVQALSEALRVSRFKATILTPRWNVVRLSRVKLRTGKEWCGSHAKACENAHKDHGNPKRTLLEGADWVEFNDCIVNNTLDKLGVSADVQSAVCIIRWGTRRRIRYESNHTRGSKEHGTFEHVWDFDGPAEHYADYTGRTAVPSDFPEGTPGIYQPLNYNVVG